jgi:ferredoxin
MKAILYYFSGTGNSKRIVDICRNELIKKQYDVEIIKLTRSTVSAGLDGVSLLGFVYPVIGLAAPRIIVQHLHSLPHAKQSVSLFLIATKGSDHNQGWAMMEPIKMLNEKGLKVIGAKSIHMPDNWMTFLKGKSEEAEKSLLEKAESSARDFILETIDNKSTIEKFQWPSFGPIASIIIKNIFRSIGIKRLWMHFKILSSCNGCGKCARICPTNSIRLENKKPRWSGTCEQCMCCVSFCPQKAIVQLEPIFHGSKNRKYHEPHFNPENEAVR